MTTACSPPEESGASGATGGSGRVEALLGEMTLPEKLAQLVGLWAGAGADGDGVAPLQNELLVGVPPFEQFAANGLGQLTRVYGTSPVEPLDGWRALRQAQQWLVDNTRLRIPAMAHEECLTGFTAYRASTFPTPLAWGASWDPALVEEMASSIGATMRAAGVHQGLAPVCDVIRDPRWGRVEECIAEDPYAVGVIAAAYVRGLQHSGIIATLKHFVGYSGSGGGRNLAPVHAGPRELAEIFLPPFEMALRLGGARSVMHSYCEIDGLPSAADRTLLTDLLRGDWGFEGTVVADYFGVSFLHSMHAVAEDLAAAAELALNAGVDVELPTGSAYLAPLEMLVRNGRVEEAAIDVAVRRVLQQKEALGLLEPGWQPAAEPLLDFDPPAHRTIARTMAEESVVLLANDGLLPLRAAVRVAVVGPNADTAHALLGTYSFTNHVEVAHPDVPMGIAVPTILAALTAEPSDWHLTYSRGCDIDSDDVTGFAAAADLARDADVVIAVMGDRAGLFGRGTVGEGSDTDSLDLPGVQQKCVQHLIATGTPVVLVLLTGRPYALEWAVGRAAAIVQAFFPGEEGAGAVAGVISGRLNPCGRLTVSFPRSAGAQPYTYLHPPLGAASAVTTLDTMPVFPFGHGLSYTQFAYSGLEVESSQIATDGVLSVSVTITNTGTRQGVEVAQLYTHDVAASTTRPMRQLTGYARVDLAAAQSVRVTFDVHTDLLSYVGVQGHRLVEPGDVDVWVAATCVEEGLHARVTLVGPARAVCHRRVLQTVVTTRSGDALRPGLRPTSAAPDPPVANAD